MNKLQQRLLGKTAGIGRDLDPPAVEETTPPDETTEQTAQAAEPPAESAAPPTPLRAPTTMPGQLAAFRNEALKYQRQIEERDAIIEELKNSTDRVQRIPLELIDDSPFQPRLEYDPAEIDSLAKTMATARQADPVKVRKVGERYELISGHRRKRAALSIGWKEIDAIVEMRSDADAELEAMLAVVANVKLSDYELAKMYDRALKKGLAKNRDKAAAIFGVTPSTVTACLAMLKLPEPILEILQERPRLFSHTTASTIASLAEEFPKHIDIVTQGVQRLYKEGAKQNSINAWVRQAIAQQKKKAAPKSGGMIVTKDGHEVFTMKKTNKSVTVNIKAGDFSSEQLERDLHAWLSSYANR